MSSAAETTHEPSNETPQHDWPRTLTPGGQTFKDRVDNPMMFRAYMMVKMPTLGVTGATLRRINVTECAVDMPFGWGVKDMFGRASTAAILSAAEVASASLMVLNLRNQGAALTPRVTNVLLGSARDVREDMTFVCEHGEGYGQFIADVAATGEPERRMFTVVGTTASGVVTHTVQIEWELAPK